MQQATGLVVLGSVDLQDQEGDRDGEDTVAERRSPGGVGQTGLILQGVLDRVLVRHDRMLALGMRRHGWATWRWKGDPDRPHPPADAAPRGMYSRPPGPAHLRKAAASGPTRGRIEVQQPDYACPAASNPYHLHQERQ